MKTHKGMEMNLIVTLVILILLLILVGLLYAGLKGQGDSFLDKLLNLF